MGLPWWLRRWRIRLQFRRPRWDPWVRKIPWRWEWQPTPGFLPGDFHRQRSLGAIVHGVAVHVVSDKESDTWKSLHENKVPDANWNIQASTDLSEPHGWLSICQSAPFIAPFLDALLLWQDHPWRVSQWLPTEQPCRSQEAKNKPSRRQEAGSLVVFCRSVGSDYLRPHGLQHARLHHFLAFSQT